MKKILYVLRGILLTPFALLYFLFGTLWHALTAPFKSGAYRKSHFARDTGARYVPGICEEEVYKLYNRLREQNIPIGVVAHPKHPLDAHLVWKRTLVIRELDSVCFREGRWCIGPNSNAWKDGLDLQKAIAEVLDDVFNNCPGCDLDDAVILIHRSDIAPEDLDRAARTPMFLLYTSDEEQFDALRKFCANA